MLGSDGKTSFVQESSVPSFDALPADPQSQVGVVGRDREIGSLTGLLGAAAEAGGSLVLRGDAGVGKTALLDFMAAQARDAGFLVLRAAGVEFEVGIGYSALGQAVLPLLSWFGQLKPFHRDALSVALGMSDGARPQRLVVSTAALQLLRLAAGQHPVLMIVDDLHWVDRASAEVFVFLARRVRGARLGFLAAARDEAAILLGQVRLDELELSPLDHQSSDSLLRERFPRLAPVVRHRLLAEARGNPLALLELPLALPGQAHTGVEALPAYLPLSGRLQSVFTTRIQALPEATRDLLLLAGLDGTGECDVLRRVTGDMSLMTLVPAEDAGVVSICGRRVVFRHPLTRAAVVTMTTGAQRRDAHRRLALALTAYPDREAWHLGESAIAPDEQVAELLAFSARRRAARGDRDAVATMLKAADLTPDPFDRGRRLIEAAYLGAFRSADHSALPVLLAHFGDRGEHTEEALYAATGAAYVLLAGDGDIRAAFRLVCDAVATAEVPQIAGTAALRAALDMIAYLCHILARKDYSEHYRQLLERLGASVPEHVHLWAETVLDPAYTARGVLGRIDAALETIDDADDGTVTALGGIAIYTDRLERTRKALERVAAPVAGEVAINNAAGAAVELWLAQFHAGDWEQARATCDRARKLCASSTGILSEPPLTYFEGILAAHTGHTVKAHRAAEWLLARAESGPARLWRLYARHILLATAASRADHSEVCRHGCAISPLGVIPEQTPTALLIFFDLVKAAVHCGRTTEAARHVQALHRLKVGEISPRLDMLLTAATAMTTPELQQARTLFDRALRTVEPEAWPFDVARIRLCYAEHLHRMGALTAAEEQLRMAHTAFVDLGAAPWAARAVPQLPPPPAPTTSAPAELDTSLSEQEHRVAQLAAQGLTNKQIGAELHLSPRTVGTYLYRAFPKLGITTRAALRDALTGLEHGHGTGPAFDDMPPS